MSSQKPRTCLILRAKVLGPEIPSVYLLKWIFVAVELDIDAIHFSTNLDASVQNKTVPNKVAFLILHICASMSNT